ncbi:unnamed protein product [Chironomus riparius]|uniref:Uncharacterized protein n=1 Tax=Chironomus riparius TaxID=315576 RepID=A0A9N9S4N9_9DIPT|nr:unnamed protein product [Chironomus riparius]
MYFEQYSDEDQFVEDQLLLMLTSHKKLKRIWNNSKSIAIYPNPLLEEIIEDRISHADSLGISLVFTWSLYGYQSGTFEFNLNVYRMINQQLNAYIKEYLITACQRPDLIALFANLSLY